MVLFPVCAFGAGMPFETIKRLNSASFCFAKQLGSPSAFWKDNKALVFVSRFLRVEEYVAPLVIYSVVK